MIPVEAKLTMKFGAGGRAMRRLVQSVFASGWDPSPEGVIGLEAMDDGAAIRIGDRWLVITTDSHVIHPIFFPGGDIGRLAISGTVNDLAMMGATEVLGLTSSMIIEDGFPLADLETVHASMVATCREARARVVTGDTKMMGKGELDGLVINTTGVAIADRIVRDDGLRPGDRIIVTGTIGDHGFAVMAHRNGIDVGSDLRSDVAPLNALIRGVLKIGGASITAMKDPTRGGVASVLSEMAEKSRVGISIEQAKLPLSPAAEGVAELLGIDPLHVANEGKAVIGVRPEAVDAVLRVLRDHPLGVRAEVIGTAIELHAGRVILDTGFGRRIVAELDGEPLPRIC
jgi:hydrogenase expression/formation protein HypE